MSDESAAPQTSKETILTIVNGHYDCCGVPPKLELGSHYTAYFENGYGEQILLQYDTEKKVCRLWHGDVGWEEELRVIEFRGRAVVVFARTPAEQKAEFRMNEQFNHGDLFPPDEQRDAEVRKAMYAALRKIYGKPRLTDEECELLSNTPILNEDERRTIAALWQMWQR